MIDHTILASFIQMAPDAVIVIDNTGAIVFANAQVQSIFGYAAEELIGKQIEILIPDHLRQTHVQHRMNYMSCPRTRPMGANLDLVGKKKNGTIFPVEISLSPVKGEGSFFVMAIVRDVSEKKKQEKQLLAANADLEHFVYVASHNLQEPLHSIQQLMELLRETNVHALSYESQDILSRIQKQAAFMSSLVKDLLDLSRIGREKELTPVDCNALIEEIKLSLQALIDRTKASIIVEGPLPTLTVFAGGFRLLLQNLMHNGIKFHTKEEAPVVIIKAEHRPSDWLFSVSDHGIGIEEKFFPKLFLLFQRFHSKEEYPGTGIGLAYCKKIVLLHGGDIWIESKDRQGTTVYFTIPHTIKG